VISPDGTRMFREAAEAPLVVREQLGRTRDQISSVVARLRALAPRAVVTCARGSSDHAATFAKYLIETRLGILTSSAAPSVSSVYAAKADLQGTLFLAISQSGASPDLVATAEAARQAGACVVAMVNAEGSPLSATAHLTIPLCAGSETSVAATKSYIASLAAIAHLVASWADDSNLLAALEAAPALLARAWDMDWTPAAGVLQPATGMYVVGRGLGLGVAQEAALKLKETCGVHAEAFSAAEVKHGPMALIGAGFPVLLFAQNDETRESVETLALELAERGATTLFASSRAARQVVQLNQSVVGVKQLEVVGAHPAIEPMLFIQSFYRAANALSIGRGRDPDHPPHLCKITETV
jgi:glucosamine--fructose-6-phosphate aminotransferase (isomerizing)